jgi:dCMP deaminase
LEKKHKRPNLDEYFNDMVRVVASRSTCIVPERQFGAIVVKNKQVISTGYNGAPRGMKDCIEIGRCVKREKGGETGKMQEECIAVHAEQNALIQAGRGAEGGTLYVNGYPCKICARLIVNAGITRVVASGEYSDLEGIKILKDAGIKVDISHR